MIGLIIVLFILWLICMYMSPVFIATYSKDMSLKQRVLGIICTIYALIGSSLALSLLFKIQTL